MLPSPTRISSILGLLAVSQIDCAGVDIDTLNVEGHVVSTIDSQPVEGAVIQLCNPQFTDWTFLGESVRSEADGFYSLEESIEAGSCHSVCARAGGYRQSDIEVPCSRLSHVIDFRLSPQ
ncbi:MAG: hypothetical protein ACYSUI_16915 [Planctomycetota bacterium]|jgi:hypothetical protein